jgi:hypothetical protein
MNFTDIEHLNQFNTAFIEFDKFMEYEHNCLKYLLLKSDNIKLVVSLVPLLGEDKGFKLLKTDDQDNGYNNNANNNNNNNVDNDYLRSKKIRTDNDIVKTIKTEEVKNEEGQKQEWQKSLESFGFPYTAVMKKDSSPTPLVIPTGDGRNIYVYQRTEVQFKSSEEIRKEGDEPNIDEEYMACVKGDMVDHCKKVLSGIKNDTKRIRNILRKKCAPVTIQVLAFGGKASIQDSDSLEMVDKEEDV